MRGGNGGSDLLVGRPREIAQQPVAVDGRTPLEAARPRLPLPVDEQRIITPEILLQLGDIFVKVFVQQRVGAAERGVGHFDVLALLGHAEPLYRLGEYRIALIVLEPAPQPAQFVRRLASIRRLCYNSNIS